MFDKDRGKIRNIDSYKQLISYEGMMRHRKITPTDIDGLIDYAGNAFIFLECKMKGKDMDYGQRRAYENIIDALYESGKPSCCIHFEHEMGIDDIIIAKDCKVVEIYFQHEWRPYHNTVLNTIELIEKKFREMNIWI